MYWIVYVILTEVMPKILAITKAEDSFNTFTNFPIFEKPLRLAHCFIHYLYSNTSLLHALNGYNEMATL